MLSRGIITKIVVNSGILTSERTVTLYQSLKLESDTGSCMQYNVRITHRSPVIPLLVCGIWTTRTNTYRLHHIHVSEVLPHL